MKNTGKFVFCHSRYKSHQELNEKGKSKEVPRIFWTIRWRWLQWCLNFRIAWPNCPIAVKMCLPLTILPDCYKNALILDQFASEFFYKTHDPCFAVAYFRLEPLPLEFWTHHPRPTPPIGKAVRTTRICSDCFGWKFYSAMKCNI